MDRSMTYERDEDIPVGIVVTVPILGITAYKCACGKVHACGERCPEDIASNSTKNKEATEAANEDLWQEQNKRK